MDSLEKFVQFLIKKALATKEMDGFEIYAEQRDTAYLSSVLDSRSRWMGEIKKNSDTVVEILCTAFVKNNRSAKEQFFFEEEADYSMIWKTLCKKARTSKSSSQFSLSVNRNIRNTGLEIWDPRYPNITDDDRKDVIGWNMEVIKQASSRAKGREFRLEETQMFRYFCASDGRKFNEKSTHFSLFGEVELQVRPPRRMSELHTSRHFADVASRPISIGIVRSLDSGERLTSNIKEDFTIVFETKVVAELMQAILVCFSYEKILEKESFLHRYIGKRIGSKKLHVIDDASLPNGVNTRAFDARGVPPLARTLICEGVVRDFYISSKDANDSEHKPTGHVGIDGKLWPGNIIIKAGRRSLNMILSTDESTIFCTHLLEPIKFDEETGDIDMLIGCSMLRE